jgi:hypothetical protein
VRPGRAALGVKVRQGKLYVAGGPTGTITVYDLASRQVVAAFQTGTSGFLNDLVVTGRGDVYVTDSFRPILWHVTAEQVQAGSGTHQALDVSAIPFEAGQFNLNGIVSEGSRMLIVVDSNSGKLFRIDLGDDQSSIRAIDEIESALSPAATACCWIVAAWSSSRETPLSCRSSSCATAHGKRRSRTPRRAASSEARPRLTGRRVCTSSSTPTSPRASGRSPLPGFRDCKGPSATTEHVRPPAVGR